MTSEQKVALNVLLSFCIRFRDRSGRIKLTVSIGEILYKEKDWIAQTTQIIVTKENDKIIIEFTEDQFKKATILNKLY